MAHGSKISVTAFPSGKGIAIPLCSLASRRAIMASMKISRRALAQLAVAGGAAAQQPQPDELLEQAQKQVELNSEILRKHPISMTAEPVFQFKA